MRVRLIPAAIVLLTLLGCKDDSGRNAPPVVEACNMAGLDAKDAHDLAVMTAWARKGLAGGSESAGAPRSINHAATELALALTNMPTPSGRDDAETESVRRFQQEGIALFQQRLAEACKR